MSEPMPLPLSVWRRKPSARHPGRAGNIFEVKRGSEQGPIQSGRPGYRGRSQSFWFWGKHGPSFDIGEPERFAVTCRTGRYMYSTQVTSALETKADCNAAR